MKLSLCKLMMNLANFSFVINHKNILYPVPNYCGQRNVLLKKSSLMRDYIFYGIKNKLFLVQASILTFLKFQYFSCFGICNKKKVSSKYSPTIVHIISQI
ncbi:unnamed protein product [Brugia timori]|uniref:ZP domain-containing protein n=1 Tax=Brugia timori TaxID=42155 RepID=A0A0R3QN93_9BILA|nr:unnamed protein product [Brugia timori]